MKTKNKVNKGLMLLRVSEFCNLDVFKKNVPDADFREHVLRVFSAARDLMCHDIAADKREGLSNCRELETLQDLLKALPRGR